MRSEVVVPGRARQDREQGLKTLIKEGWIVSPHAEHLRFLASNSADVICRCDADGMLHYVSPSSIRVLGWTPEEMIGKRVLDFVATEDMPLLVNAIAQWQTPEVEVNTVIARLERSDGSTCWSELHAGIVHDDSGMTVGVAVIIRDVSERKRVEDRLAMLALTDGLTGLANRRSFDEALEREWTRTLKDGSQLSLVLLDIDHFKKFNDRYGHQAGDACLRAIASRIASAVRKSDIVARYGGEEIAVILPECTSVRAVAIAEKIRCAIECLEIPHEDPVTGTTFVTASIGVTTALAQSAQTMQMPETLLLIADSALYQAKHSGRNAVVTAELNGLG